MALKDKPTATFVAFMQDNCVTKLLPDKICVQKNGNGSDLETEKEKFTESGTSFPNLF